MIFSLLGGSLSVLLGQKNDRMHVVRWMCPGSWPLWSLAS